MPAAGEQAGTGTKGNGSDGGGFGIAHAPRFAPNVRQSDQASRLESIGQLAGGVAHDFNNLLGVILNYADFVAQQLEEGSPAHTDVLEIRRAAERGTELTKQLLIFSRREAIQPQPVDLNATVRDMERLLRRTLGEHIQLIVSLAPELPTVLADPGQLEQVLVNLAVNSRDAMPQGGRLQIRTSEVELDEEFVHEHSVATPGPHARLTVADTGSGMTPAVAARAFEPFYSTKRKGEGTGLGLATVYGIVKGAGGQISLYSEPGLGTRVKVDLPAIDARVPGHPDDPAEDVPLGRGERILVVEDEDAVRTLATRILTQGGYRVTAVGSGREALALLTDPGWEFDLLLSDVVMPEMRGIELVRRTHGVRPDLAVLMMSGYTTPLEEAERDAMAEGSLLEKPFSGPKLLRAVRELLDSGVRQ
jgi:CheY-like chemotaxis protein